MEEQDLLFFCKVNAAISHELKNILAIVSETAGLLNDLTELAKMGKPIAPPMLENCTTNIMEGIQRGFSTIKEMNRFAHSVDEPMRKANIAEILELMVNLSSYLSFAAKVRCDFDPEVPEIFTSPFRLQQIIYHALIYVFKTADPREEVTLSLKPDGPGGARIIIAGMGSNDVPEFPSGEVEQYARELGVKIDLDGDSGTLEVVVAPLK